MRCRVGSVLGDADLFGEFADRRVLEKLLEREVQSSRERPGPHAYAADRISAQREVVVVNADPSDAERLGPDFCQRPLDLCARRDEDAFEFRLGPIGRGQQLAINFAVLCQRQGFEEDEGGRDHVLRQLVFQKLAQVAARRARSFNANTVSHQSLFSRHILPRQNDALPDGRMARERRIDLTEFDAESVNLHLIVGAAQIL